MAKVLPNVGGSLEGYRLLKSAVPERWQSGEWTGLDNSARPVRRCEGGAAMAAQANFSATKRHEKLSLVRRPKPKPAGELSRATERWQSG